MATTVELSADSLAGFDFDARGVRYPYTSRVSWPMPVEHNQSRVASHRMANLKRSTSPLQGQAQLYEQPFDQHPQALLPEWHVSQPPATNLGYSLDTTFHHQYTDSYTVPFQTSPTEFIPLQPHIDSSLTMEGSFIPLTNQMDNMQFGWQGSFSNEMIDYAANNGLPDMTVQQQSLPENSPTVRSITTCSSVDGWNSLDFPQQPLDFSLQDGAVFNPGQTLLNRTFSDSSSYSDYEQLQSRQSCGSYVMVSEAISSPGTDSVGDMDLYSEHSHYDHAHYPEDDREPSNPPAIATSSALVKPIDIKKPTSPQKSPTSTGKSSPPVRRQSRKIANPKVPKPKPAKAENEKRIGKRKGPLRPEQRKQACEIRKLGACLRCKFLKKTCDKGEPCTGCKPSHARLWQVPCTRIDIKEIAYFMKDWKADYERHVSLGFSVGNIKGYADVERILFITHGYGHMLPVRAREVFVRDERCFGLDWVETIHTSPEEYSVNTAKLCAGMEGISTHMLSDYLDRHIDGGFEEFVDDYFEGTPFLTEMLKTAYRFWLREKTPVIRKSLKLLLAYNLTQHVTMVQGIPEEEGFLGKITDETSKFFGQTVAPVMINFQIKCALADMWRELQKDILVELSSLYSSVYTRDKLKHWPTIFMVASILLGVWEEMQFDCHYRIPDTAVVSKFCNDMESTPVGVIVGLFAAISQKLPALAEWDSRKHHTILNSNPAVCEALDEVRDHVTRHETYLRQRCSASFDRDDFDSLSGKFVSKLVIRAN